jgi:hypothetical protein
MFRSRMSWRGCDAVCLRSGRFNMLFVGSSVRSSVEIIFVGITGIVHCPQGGRILYLPE